MQHPCSHYNAFGNLTPPFLAVYFHLMCSLSHLPSLQCIVIWCAVSHTSLHCSVLSSDVQSLSAVSDTSLHCSVLSSDVLSLTPPFIAVSCHLMCCLSHRPSWNLLFSDVRCELAHHHHPSLKVIRNYGSFDLPTSFDDLFLATILWHSCLSTLIKPFPRNEEIQYFLRGFEEYLIFAEEAAWKRQGMR